MKKAGIGIAVATVLVLVLVLASLPAVLGVVTEHRVRARIEAMQQGSLTAKLLSYERGWLASRARIELTLSPRYLADIEALDPATLPPDAAAPDQRATLLVEFMHGPIAIGDGIFFGLSKTVARLDPASDGIGELERRLGVPYLFEFRGRTGFLGSTAFDADLSPIHLPLAGTTLDFSGATVSGVLRGRHLTSNLELGSIAFSTPSGAFGLRNLAGSIDSEIRSRYVVPGTLQLTLEHAVIADADVRTPLFELENLNTTSSASLDPTGAELEMQMTYSVDALRAEGMAFTDVNLGVALHKIDVAAMKAYFDNASLLSDDRDSPERAAMLAALTPLVARALAGNPSLVLNPVRFTLNDEPFDAHAEFTTDPAALPPPGALDLEDPGLWLAVVKSQATVKISKLLAKQLAVVAVQTRLANDMPLPPEQLHSLAEAQAGLVLAALAGQGMLRNDGDSYLSDIKVADGLLTVNGRPLPLGLR